MPLAVESIHHNRHGPGTGWFWYREVLIRNESFFLLFNTDLMLLLFQ